MMNENILNSEELDRIVPLTDEELAAVAGGSHSYIEGDDGKSYIHPIPDKHSKRLGVLHVGEDARYLHNTSVDDRGVLWYQIKWNGQEAWVSSRYTKKVRF